MRGYSYSMDHIFEGAEFSPDGTFVLTRHAHTALLWRVDTEEKCPFHFYHVGYLGSATFSPTGTTVLGASQMTDVKLGASPRDGVSK